MDLFPKQYDLEKQGLEKKKKRLKKFTKRYLIPLLLK